MDWASFNNAASEFSRSADDAEQDGISFEEAVPLAQWLASRSVLAQLGLLVAALGVLDKLGDFVGVLTDTEVPETTQAATALVFAVAAFLLLWLDYRSRPPEE